MKSTHKVGLGLAAILLLAVSASSLRGGDDRHGNGWKSMVIDVACDATTFALNKTGSADTGPVRGSSFIVNGKIYPGGTIPSGNGFDINTPGRIGTWICRGAFNFSDASVPAQSSTQRYLFDPSGSLVTRNSLSSVGEEGGVTTDRVVSGGTGMFRGVVGEVKQEVLGINSSGLFNFRFTFKVRTPE